MKGFAHFTLQCNGFIAQAPRVLRSAKKPAYPLRADTLQYPRMRCCDDIVQPFQGNVGVGANRAPFQFTLYPGFQFNEDVHARDASTRGVAKKRSNLFPIGKMPVGSEFLGGCAAAQGYCVEKLTRDEVTTTLTRLTRLPRGSRKASRDRDVVP